MCTIFDNGNVGCWMRDLIAWANGIHARFEKFLTVVGARGRIIFLINFGVPNDPDTADCSSDYTAE